MNQKERNRLHYEKAKPAYNALMKFYPLTTDDLDGEIWKPISDYDGYEVSNFGRVKSFKYNSPRILKPELRGVYLSVNLYNKHFQVHRLVALAFIPNPDNKPQINHIDGHKLNNYAGNLEWTTASENIQHAFATGLKIAMQGEDNVRAKFTSEQVIYIRSNPDNLTIKEFAEKLGVDLKTITRIQLGQRYKQVSGTVRKPLKKYTPPISDEVKRQIRAEYKKGVRGCGAPALAKKYGLGQTTIFRIVHSAE